MKGLQRQRAQHQNWKDYAAYVGGKGRYWRVQRVDGTWQDVRATGKKARQIVKMLIREGKLLALREAPRAV